MRRVTMIALATVVVLVVGWVLTLSLRAVTVAAQAPTVAGTGSGATPSGAGPDDAGPDALPAPTPEPTRPVPRPPDPAVLADRDAGVLGGDVPASGPGDLGTVPGGTDAPPGDGDVMTVRVEVEQGLDVDRLAFARFVMRTLTDPRGWGSQESGDPVRFARTDGEADIRVVLASPGTVDVMCAPLATNGRWSCGREGHAVLNADRWTTGAQAFLEGGGEVTAYRQYLVNHEVGHLLGQPHVECGTPGRAAPVMVQQSISLGGCEPNGWPHP